MTPFVFTIRNYFIKNCMLLLCFQSDFGQLVSHLQSGSSYDCKVVKKEMAKTSRRISVRSQCRHHCRNVVSLNIVLTHGVKEITNFENAKVCEIQINRSINWNEIAYTARIYAQSDNRPRRDSAERMIAVKASSPLPRVRFKQK